MLCIETLYCTICCAVRVRDSYSSSVYLFNTCICNTSIQHLYSTPVPSNRLLQDRLMSKTVDSSEDGLSATDDWVRNVMGTETD